MTKAPMLLLLFFVIVIAGNSCKPKDSNNIVTQPASSLDSCNYFANRGFEFRKGKWIEQQTPERLASGDQPGEIQFISDTLISWINGNDIDSTPMKFYRCNNLEFKIVDPSSQWNQQSFSRGVFYDDKKNFLIITSIWVNRTDTVIYKKE